MAAKVKIVPTKDWEIIREYLNEEGVLLIPENIAKEQNVEYLNGKNIDYDFGGEADCWIDIAASKKHTFFQDLVEKNK